MKKEIKIKEIHRGNPIKEDGTTSIKISTLVSGKTVFGYLFSKNIFLIPNKKKNPDTISVRVTHDASGIDTYYKYDGITSDSKFKIFTTI